MNALEIHLNCCIYQWFVPFMVNNILVSASLPFFPCETFVSPKGGLLLNIFLVLSVAFLETRATEAERGVIQAKYSGGRCGPPCSRRALCLFIRPVTSSSRVYLNRSADNDSTLSKLKYFSMIYVQHIVDLMGFPGDSVIKNLPANARDMALIL